MKVYEHPEWRPFYPEKFNWALLDSDELADLADELAARITTELQTCPTRRQVPGLRLALCILADQARIY